MERDLGGARNLLVLAPHPDDEALGCGGAICAAIQQGAVATTVFVTDGERLEGAPSAEIASLRRAEALAAAEVLRCAAPRFLGLPDGAVGSHAGLLAERLEALFACTKPELVFCPSPLDHHDDHRALAAVVLDIFRKAPDFRLAFYEVYGTVRFTHLIDIEEFLERKKEAIRSYRTSLYGKPELYVTAALGLNAHRSLFTQEERRYEAFWILDRAWSEEAVREWLLYLI